MGGGGGVRVIMVMGNENKISDEKNEILLQKILEVKPVQKPV